jgi:transposase
VEHYAGLDVSLELTSVCIVDAQGGIVRETKIASEPEVLVQYLQTQELEIGSVGLEAGPLSQWLHAGLVGAGFDAVLLETRHVKAALSAMTVKTDRRDARGIAQLLRLGWYRPVHAKSVSAQEVRALLTARRLIQAKLLDIESGIRGLLRGFGLKVGPISRGRFKARIVELVDGHAMLETVIGAMLAARAALEAEFKCLHRTLLTIVRADPVCRQLMSVPGVGAIVAITYKSGVDDPTRFKHSRDVGPQ